MKAYDSAEDTMAHIEQVRQNIAKLFWNLKNRAAMHDATKLESPEKAAFDVATPQLKGLTYGSPEYDAAKGRLGAALNHHYAHNSHHPEYFANGVDGMSLLDVAEMVADWVAAVKRHDDGNIWESIGFNAKRFNMSDQLVTIITNTVIEMGWGE